MRAERKRTPTTCRASTDRPAPSPRPDRSRPRRRALESAPATASRRSCSPPTPSTSSRTDVNGGARVRGVQRGAQRRPQRRDAARQLLRAGRGRAVRPRHRQPAVRRLAREHVSVPGRRDDGRRRSRNTSCAAYRQRSRPARSPPSDRLGARSGRSCRAPRSWLEGSGCDAFLLHTSTDDPLETATAWNRDLLDRPEAYADARSLAREFRPSRDRAARLRPAWSCGSGATAATAGWRRSSCRARRFARPADT